MTAPADAPRRRGFHRGEVLVQERVGKAAEMAAVGDRVIRDYMPEQHRGFFATLPFLVVGSLDRNGQPWASVLAGAPGFISSPDMHTLRVAALPGPHDPLAAGLRVGAPLGLLGIEPPTRRRNRMNGIVTAVDASGFSVQVLESFGNCPKYIQARAATFDGAGGAAGQPIVSANLDGRSRQIVAAGDTFFIATAYPDAGKDPAVAYGADVSHRGGKPGFVRFTAGDGDTPDRLTVPDFLGNFFFNTFGNIALNPKVGLLFMPVDSGEVLQIAGSAEVVFEGPELAAYPGAQRLLCITVKLVRRVAGAQHLEWDAQAELSPYLQTTGSWSG